MPVDVYEEKLLTEIAIKASDIAKETKSKILLPEHFLSVILQDKFIVNLLTKKDAEKYENVVKMLNDFCMNSNDIDRITDEDSSDELIISPLISIYISYVTVCNKSCLDILSKNKDFYKINLLGFTKSPNNDLPFSLSLYQYLSHITKKMFFLQICKNFFYINDLFSIVNSPFIAIFDLLLQSTRYHHFQATLNSAQNYCFL